MDPIDKQHVSRPGLLVLDITASDEETALTALGELDRVWASSGSHRVWRVPGQAGVKARLYADLRRPGTDDK
ncbi:MAG TPA: DUF6207 family protein [Pseudonocardiaceae bacterium]|nr:DUF6207 family protein [Pseudonocardiaceae bacterium]